MTSALMDIANTMSTDFMDAVKDAEKADVETIDSIVKEMNEAWADFEKKDALLNTKAEQALRTMGEISDLRDMNTVTYQRRIADLRQQLEQFRESKLVTLPATPGIKLVGA